jgi:hypothetical protein
MYDEYYLKVHTTLFSSSSVNICLKVDNWCTLIFSTLKIECPILHILYFCIDFPWSSISAKNDLVTY